MLFTSQLVVHPNECAANTFIDFRNMLHCRTMFIACYLVFNCFV